MKEENIKGILSIDGPVDDEKIDAFKRAWETVVKLIKEVNIVNLAPNDVLVVKLKHEVSRETMNTMTDCLNNVFPDNKTVIASDILDGIIVVKPTECDLKEGVEVSISEEKPSCIETGGLLKKFKDGRKFFDPAMDTKNLPCSPIHKPDTEEPKNNDGRSNCYWCGEVTHQIEGLTSVYNSCNKCGK